MTLKNSIQIIGLNGSPHFKGNTATLMSWVLKGCEKAGAKVEWINLKDYNIKYCQGCHTCLRTGECAIKDDDFIKILERLISSDGIVVGSPVYADGPTALLKTLMDRFTLLNLFVGIFEKQYTVGVSTSGFAPNKKLAKKIAMVMGHKIGVIGVKTSSIKNGYQSLKDLKKDRLNRKAHELGRKLVSSIRLNKKPHSFMYWWINFLRKHLIKRVIKNNPEQFSGILPIWQQKGWLKPEK